MIRIRTIQAAIRDVLYEKFNNKYKVLFESNQVSDGPYFYVSTLENRATFDDCYLDRTVQIDITFIPPEDMGGRYERAESYKMLDQLSGLFCPLFKVDGRVITILTTEQTIIDNCAHYIFTAQFTDNFDKENEEDVQTMSELTFTIERSN